MKSKHVSEPFLEGDVAGGGGSRRQPGPSRARILHSVTGRALLHLSSSSSPKWQQLSVGTQGARTEAEQSWQLANLVDEWSRERGIGCTLNISILMLQLHECPSLPPAVIFQTGKTPNRLLGSRSAFSEVLLKRGDEPICIFPLKHGGMFLLHYSVRSGLPQACS